MLSVVLLALTLTLDLASLVSTDNTFFLTAAHTAGPSQQGHGTGHGHGHGHGTHHGHHHGHYGECS